MYVVFNVCVLCVLVSVVQTMCTVFSREPDLQTKSMQPNI